MQLQQEPEFFFFPEQITATKRPVVSSKLTWLGNCGITEFHARSFWNALDETLLHISINMLLIGKGVATTEKPCIPSDRFKFSLSFLRYTDLTGNTKCRR
jgi:hypothetical protein